MHKLVTLVILIKTDKTLSELLIDKKKINRIF